MKKVLCMLLAIGMCISLVACGESSEPSKPKKPALDARQNLVNICCDYENCRSLGNFNTGTLNVSETETGYKVTAKGTYYPVNSYGEYGNKRRFDIEFMVTWDGESSYYSNKDMKIIRKSISNAW